MVESFFLVRRCLKKPRCLRDFITLFHKGLEGDEFNMFFLDSSKALVYAPEAI